VQLTELEPLVLDGEVVELELEGEVVELELEGVLELPDEADPDALSRMHCSFSVPVRSSQLAAPEPAEDDGVAVEDEDEPEADGEVVEGEVDGVLMLPLDPVLPLAPVPPVELLLCAKAVLPMAKSAAETATPRSFNFMVCAPSRIRLERDWGTTPGGEQCVCRGRAGACFARAWS
jgi:hypothetical protein